MSAGWLIVAVAVVAAVHRYAVEYGYRGVDASPALHEAIKVGVTTLLVLTILGLVTGRLQRPHIACYDNAWIRAGDCQ